MTFGVYVLFFPFGILGLAVFLRGHSGVFQIPERQILMTKEP